MKPYIDVRGPWPQFFVGMNVITLVGCDRNITLTEASLWICKHYADKIVN